MCVGKIEDTFWCYTIFKSLSLCVCVCVCVCMRATLWGPNVPTRIVKPEFFDIVRNIRGGGGIKNWKWS